MTRRLLIISYDFHPARGGQGRHTFELWRRLRQSGHFEVSVLSPTTNNLPSHVSAGKAMSRVGKGIGFSVYLASTLARWEERLRPDVIQLNGGPGGVLLLGRPHAPVVYTAHHTYAQQSRLVPGQRWKHVFVPLEARGYRLAKAVVADTPSTSRAVREDLGVHSDWLRVIPSGIDVSDFRPSDSPREPGAVLFVGRLDKRKGILFLLEAWSHVARERPDAHLYVIGDGPLREAARRFTIRAGLQRNVTLLGRVSQDELVGWYGRASAVAVPSVFEGLGLTAVEAMACGTPVVATDTDGLRDVVEDGLDGRLAPYGEPNAFADALLQVLATGAGLSRERVERVRATYDWSKLARDYAALYETVLEAA